VRACQAAEVSRLLDALGLYIVLSVGLLLVFLLMLLGLYFAFRKK
jgi:hypothetical protein